MEHLGTPTLDVGFVRGLITALTMAVFLGICWWAYTGQNRERFEEDAFLPFEDDEPIDARPEDVR